MPPMENIPIWPTNSSTSDHRRGPLRSRTVDNLFRILSICYADSSNITQNSDKGDTRIGSVTKNDGPLTSTNVIPNVSVHQEEKNVDETRVVLGIQEKGLCNTHVELVEQDHNISKERKEISSPHLVTDKDVEEGEISGESMNLILEDDVEYVDKTGSAHEEFIGIEPGSEKTNNLTPLSINTVDDIGKDMTAVISKTKRTLVDYSEVALHGNSKESAHHELVLPLQSNFTNSATKNKKFASPIKDKGAQNNKKRRGSRTDEKGTNKKARKSVNQSTCPEDLTTVDKNPDDASREGIGASANKDADTEKKKKKVLTAERKEKKKRKERIKRAEKNRKSGVKRLKLQPVIKEKKINYCRHYLNGKCYEGENCKFSHDTIPLTKSIPCPHFARQSCMKGNDCPFDHQLSKYPCKKYLSKGSCPRGSDCMFSHEAQPSASEASLNTPNGSTSEQKPPNPSSKMQINNHGSSPKLSVQPPKGVSFMSREKIDAKSCPVRVSVNTEQNLVMTTPKLSQPPKGISFFSQKKLPLEASLSPKVNSEVKESGEITKTPPVIPRGINFLSFGKKPGLDGSNSGFSFKIGNGIGKSPLSKPEGIIVNMDDGVKAGTQIGNNDKKGTNSEYPTDGQTSFRKSMPVLSNASQRTLQSTLAFAAKFDSGVKINRCTNLSRRLKTPLSATKCVLLPKDLVLTLRLLFLWSLSSNCKGEPQVQFISSDCQSIHQAAINTKVFISYV